MSRLRLGGKTFVRRGEATFKVVSVVVSVLRCAREDFGAEKFPSIGCLHSEHHAAQRLDTVKP